MMKYEDAVELERLASEVFEKCQVVEALCAMNTPTDLAEQGRAFVRLQLAQGDLAIAENHLRQAQAELVCYGHLKEAKQNEQMGKRSRGSLT
jgi:hypothetical protein